MVGVGRGTYTVGLGAYGLIVMWGTVRQSNIVVLVLVELDVLLVLVLVLVENDVLVLLELDVELVDTLVDVLTDVDVLLDVLLTLVLEEVLTLVEDEVEVVVPAEAAFNSNITKRQFASPVYVAPIVCAVPSAVTYPMKAEPRSA